MRVLCIDVLKAFAIIAVILYHSGYMPFGYLGVDIFLVINGYLVTKGLYRRMLGDNAAINGRWGYVKFINSRIERLLPPLLVAGIVCMAVGFFVMIDETYESLAQSVIATNFFGNNIVELIATGNYWATDKAFSPLMHTWYVGLIMQFYLLYPILFYIAKHDNGQPQRTLFSLLLVLGVISLLLFVGENNTARKFYLLPARFFEFAAGGIVALLLQSKEPDKQKSINKYYVYGGYLLLLFLCAVNITLIPANVKLLSVVALTCLMLCSQEVLENSFTANVVMAKIGAASYSIFIWHQIVFAYYRSVCGSHFSCWGYITCLIVIALFSFVSYYLIEKRTDFLLKSNNGKRKLLIRYGTVFIILNLFTFVIYLNAGVVRDIDELDVYKEKPNRGMWARYNSDIVSYDKPFQTEKLHWFVIGNSYGRDFVNIILESSVSELVEVSYCDIKDFKSRQYEERFQSSNKIFIASKWFTQDIIHDIEILALATGHDISDVIVVGDKNFGETMEQVYVRRNRRDYFDTHVKMLPGFWEKNEEFKVLYSGRYIDLISMYCNVVGDARVFTPDHKFISSDCGHITRSGAKFFAELINWSNYMEDN